RNILRCQLDGARTKSKRCVNGERDPLSRDHSTGRTADQRPSRRAEMALRISQHLREIFVILRYPGQQMSDRSCETSGNMRKEAGTIIYSPSDLIRYLASPFASWLDRYELENRGAIKPDEQTEEEKLLSRTGDEHEQSILSGYKTSGIGLIEIAKDDNQFDVTHSATLDAIQNKAAIIYQAA